MFKVKRTDSSIKIVDLEASGTGEAGNVRYELDGDAILLLDDGPVYAKNVADIPLISYLSSKHLI